MRHRQQSNQSAVLQELEDLRLVRQTSDCHSNGTESHYNITFLKLFIAA